MVICSLESSLNRDPYIIVPMIWLGTGRKRDELRSHGDSALIQLRF